jgi:carbamoyltransferase
MVILGINGVDGIFHDASASLVVDGKIIASVEEERFNRLKHSNGIPFQAIEFCLRKAGLAFSDVDHIGYYLHPDVLRKTLLTDIVNRFHCDDSRLAYIDEAANSIKDVEGQLRKRFSSKPGTEIHFLNHHIAHAASVYYIAGLPEAAVLTVDGSGDRESCALFRGSPRGLEKIHDFLVYPESLGFVYTVFAAHLGLNWISGPGKLMGLAGYGRRIPALFEDIIQLHEDPVRPVVIDLSFFEYHLGGPGLSAKGLKRFGQPLAEGAALNQDHCDLAASVQTALQQAVLHIVRQIPYFLPDQQNLCFSGGVALNVTTNRRIRDCWKSGGFFVTPPAYDGGTSLGCALYLDAKFSGRRQYDFDVYAGPDIERDFDIEAACQSFGKAVEWERISECELIGRAAQALADDRFVGWVQGRMECGPRALGNRSILGNPTYPETKDRLNEGIKKREAFRPYAPSVCQEESAAWFDLDESPFMLLEARVHSQRRAAIPAVTHVDGTSRPQTVTERANPRYYKLIRAFFERTGVPMVLNTSFNQHGEPMVNRPEEAIAALLSTTLDDLFIGDYHVRRSPAFHEKCEWIPVAGGGVWITGEIPGAIDPEPVVHNDTSVKRGEGMIQIVTGSAQWSFAAGFRLNTAPFEEGLKVDALLIRVEIRVRTGRMGILVVGDDLQSVVGTPLEMGTGEDRGCVALLVESLPAPGWLILRNNAAGNGSSTCVVSNVQVFAATRHLPQFQA